MDLFSGVAMTVRKKSQSKTRMQGKTSYRARYVELAHQGFRLREWSNASQEPARPHQW